MNFLKFMNSLFKVIINSLFQSIVRKTLFNKILVKISVDSPKELNLIKYKIADYFNSYLDTPEEAGDFSKFIGFLKTGQSNHFTLIGINYFDNEFKLSIFPQNNNDKNIASYGPFRRLASTYSKESIGNLVSIRIK